SIINGASDWVYEEEFETIRAYEWSPDGKFLAFLRFDEEQVPSVTLEYFYPDKNYSVPYTFKYPKVGEPNSVVTLHLIDMSSKTVFPAKIPEPYEYMPRIHWLGNQLAVTTLNRLQNQMTIWT